MKKLNILAIFLMSLFAFVGCGKDDGVIPKAEYGKLAFVFDKSELDANSMKAGSVYSLDEVTAAVVTIKKAGVVLENYNTKQISLNNWGSGVYTTEDIQLEVGADYSLAKFELLNSADVVIYATPLEGSELADKVVYPLPIAFEISKDMTTPVDVEVISTEERVVEQFGYVHFVVSDKTDNGGDPVVEGEMIDNGDGTITDSRDNHVYKIVTIGDHVWMAENIAYLPSVNTYSEVSQDDPYYYVYGYNGGDLEVAKAEPNYTTYGVMYNGPAALAVAPKGWHLPSDEEWKEMEMFLGMSQENADKLNEYRGIIAPQLKATEGWDDFGTLPGGGSNETGFTALPGGYFGGSVGLFKKEGEIGSFWTSTRRDMNTYKNLFIRELDNYYAGVGRSSINMSSAVSVRLVKDK